MADYPHYGRPPAYPWPVWLERKMESPQNVPSNSRGAVSTQAGWTYNLLSSPETQPMTPFGSGRQSPYRQPYASLRAEGPLGIQASPAGASRAVPFLQHGTPPGPTPASAITGDVLFGTAATVPRASPRRTRSSRKTEDEAPPVATTASPVSRPRRTTRKRKRTSSQISPPSDAKDPPRVRKTAPGKKKEGNTISNANDDGNCCICMCEPEPSEKASINGCEHIFCFGCIEKWADRENTCPLCKVRFSKIDRVTKRRKGGRGAKNTKRVKNRDQRSDLAHGSALQGLFASMEAGGTTLPGQIARLVFGGFAELNGPSPMMIATRRAVRWGEAAPSTHAAQPSQPLFFGRHAAQTSSVGAHSEHIEDSLFSSDEDDEDFDTFVERFRAVNRQVDNVGLRIDSLARQMAPMRVAMAPQVPFPHAQPRSYAINRDDVDAGETAENALEIESDSDDEVEVVRVARSGAS